MAIRTATEAHIAPHDRVLDRLSARLHSRELDEALARGTSPEETTPLALRARRLTALSRRQTIAESLRGLIRDARQGTPPSRVRISPRRSVVVTAADELTHLADALASPGPVAARGVAQARMLLTDGTGPLYSPYSTANLSDRAARAARSLRLQD